MSLLLGAGLAAPTTLVAQDLPAQALTPLPPVAPTEPAPTPALSEPEPAPVEAKPTPDHPAPTTVAPVLVVTDEKEGKASEKVGAVAAGVLGGVAGAAVAGPVGKLAGGFVGKRIAKGLFSGGKDKIPDVRVVNAAPPPSAETVGRPASAAATANGPSPVD